MITWGGSKKINRHLIKTIVNCLKNIFSIKIKMGAVPIFLFLVVLLLLDVSGNAYADMRTWTGGGADNKWSTAGNWDVIPVGGDDIRFDGTTAPNPNKDCTIDQVISVGWFDTDGYTGTITQSANVTTSSDLSFKEGAWTASAGVYAITVGGSLNLGNDDAESANMNLSSSTGTFAITGDANFQAGGAGASTLTLGSQALSCGGHWSSEDANATFTCGTSKVTLSGTTKNLNTSSTNDFYDLDVSGSYTLLSDIDVGRHLTITGTGTLDGSDKTITLTGATGNLDIDGTFTYNTSTVDLQGTGEIQADWKNFYNLTCAAGGEKTTVDPGSAWSGINVYGLLTVGAGELTDVAARPQIVNLKLGTASVTNGGTINLSGDVTFEGGTSNMSGGNYSSTRIRILDDAAVTLTGSINPSGTWIVGDGNDDKTSTLDLDGNDIITSSYFDIGQSGQASRVGQVTCGAGSITGGTDFHLYTAANGADECSINLGSGSHSFSGDFTVDAVNTIFTPGTSTVTLNGAAASTSTISGDITFYNFTCNTASKKLVFADASTQTIATGGTLTLNGQALGTEITLDSQTPGTYWNIDCEDVQAVSFVSVIDSDASSGQTITADNSINRGHNDNWTFNAVTRYWVAPGNSDWDTNANWSSTSGGAPPADYPDAGDTAIFDNGSAFNCTLDVAVSIATLDMQGGGTAYNGIISCGTNNFTTSANMDVTSGTFTVGANTTQVGGTLTIDGGTATFTSGALDCNGAVDIQVGTLTAPDGTGGNFNIATNWSYSGGTFTHSSGTVIFDTAAASTIANNTTFHNLNCTQAGKQINFTAGTNQTVNNTLTLTGTNGNLVTLRSTATPAKWDITFPNGAQTVSYIDVQDSDANTNIVTCYNSTNSGNNNANWLFDDLDIDVPTAGSTVGQTPTIMGTVGAGDVVIIRGNAGMAEVARVTADANGNYRISQSDYTASLATGANNIRADVGAVQGVAVAITVSAAPTTSQVPTIISPVENGSVRGNKPTMSGKGTPGAAVTLTANDENGNLLLTNVATTTVDANGDWTILSANYTTALVKGINYLSVTVGGTASNVRTATFVDPFGIVFDSLTDNPIANATVTIFNTNGTQCTPGTEIAATDFNPQTTGTDGAYSFLCANGNYYITVASAGYKYPSTKTTFPASRVIVNGSKGETFTVAGVIIEMDHPMDPTYLLLKIKKDANKKETVIGDIVTYTVTIKNIVAVDVVDVFLEDMIPGGFKYIRDRATLDGIPLNPTGNRPIVFDIGTVAAGETRTLKYQLIVGSGVTQGNYENTAWAKYSDDTIISNKDHETVKIVFDPLFDLGNIVGKVFWDRNENGVQDRIQKTEDSSTKHESRLPALVGTTPVRRDGNYELGIANVQLAMEDGTVVTTGKDGKYHLPLITPGRHLVRIDESTLPENTYLTTDKVLVVDITPGILTKVNFGVNTEDKEGKAPVTSLPIRIIQKKERPEPSLNVSLYQSSVISYQETATEAKSPKGGSPKERPEGVPVGRSRGKIEDEKPETDYEFRIFTNYSLFIKNWFLNILDKDTKALIKSFEGNTLTINRPIYWDGKDKDGNYLKPDHHYVYTLTVTGEDGRRDTTKEKKLSVISSQFSVLSPQLSKTKEEKPKAEDQKLKTKWLRKQSHINNLSTRNILIKGDVVLIEGKGSFETVFPEYRTELLLPEIEQEPGQQEDTSKGGATTIIVNDIQIPIIAIDERSSEFTQQVILPEGEHRVAVESVDEEGREQKQVKHIKVGEDYLFFVAMGDAKAGYTFHTGHIEPIQHDDRFREGYWARGKAAYYLKGKILGKYLITSSLVTDRDQQRLFHNLDQNKYYPVYGDTADLDYDATETQGMLYVLIEWDKSSALWGNYVVDFTGTDLIASFKRTLYGGKLDYQTISTTQFGEPRTRAIVFKARAKQKAAHNEFIGTGGSLFYLKHKHIVEGSEKVTIEVRDKITGLVLGSIEQEEGFDYEIRYVQGRLLFWEPVSYVIESDTIISTYLLDGNPIYVVVDYEYEVKDKYDRGVYGARAEQSLTDYLRVGGTYVKEEQVGKNYELAGGDATIHIGKDTAITGEYAKSESEGVGRFISTDGGLHFTELPTDDTSKGQAYGAKAETHLFDKLGVAGYYKKIDKDFSSISTASQAGKELTGGGVTFDFTPKTRFKAQYDVQKLIDDGNSQTRLQVGAQKTQSATAQIIHEMNKLKLTGEYRHQDVTQKIEEFESETNQAGDTLAARADYKLTDKVILSLEQQATLRGSPNQQTTAGIKARLIDSLTINARETVGNRGAATTIGTSFNITDRLTLIGDYTKSNYRTGEIANTASITARASVDEDSEVYHTYSVSNSSREGQKTSSVTGTSTRIGPALEFSLEEEMATSKQETSNANIFSLSGDVNDKLGGLVTFERGEVQNLDGTQYLRSAPALGLSYVDKNKVKASVKLEARFDEGQEDKRQLLGFTAIEGKVTPDFTLYGKSNFSQSRNRALDSTMTLYKEFIAGAAYRPIAFDWFNLLAKYNYLEDDYLNEQVDFEDVEKTQAHIVSAEFAFDITNRWQFVEKQAMRIGKEKVTGFDFTDTQTWLMIHRLNYNIYRDWQLCGEYRRLAQRQAKDSKQGALIEIARNIGSSIQAGVGYNFTDFDDNLTSLDYTAHGPFIRLTGKFYDRTPQERERLRKRQEQKRIEQWSWQLVNYELTRPDSEIAQELYYYFYLGERAQELGRLKASRKFYTKVIQIGNMMYQEAQDYVGERLRLEKQLRKYDELAATYYKEGKLEEARQLWQKIIEETALNIFPAW